MKKSITIDDLAAMVQRGFKETAKQVDVDKRFDAVDERLDHIEKLILANTSGGSSGSRVR